MCTCMPSAKQSTRDAVHNPLPLLRNSWTALELARYLIEERTSDLDPDWRAHVDALFHYALTLFSVTPGLGNATLMGEQDNDKKA